MMRQKPAMESSLGSPRPRETAALTHKMVRIFSSQVSA